MDEIEGIGEALLGEYEALGGDGDGLWEAAGVADFDSFELEADQLRGGGRRRSKRSGGGRSRRGGTHLRQIEKKIDAIVKAVGAEPTEGSSGGPEGFLDFAESEGEGEDTPDEMDAGEVAIRKTDDLVLEEALGEAADTESEIKAQSLTGATVLVLTNSPLQVKTVAPEIVGGASRLVRLLRQSPKTKPLVGVVPKIIKKTTETLNAKAAKGKPITARTVKRVMGKHAAATLGSPRKTVAALKSNQLKRRELRKRAKQPAEGFA